MMTFSMFSFSWFVECRRFTVLCNFFSCSDSFLRNLKISAFIPSSWIERRKWDIKLLVKSTFYIGNCSIRLYKYPQASLEYQQLKGVKSCHNPHDMSFCDTTTVLSWNLVQVVFLLDWGMSIFVQTRTGIRKASAKGPVPCQVQNSSFLLVFC